jgi:hypothetical protein
MRVRALAVVVLMGFSHMIALMPLWANWIQVGI